MILLNYYMEKSKMQQIVLDGKYLLEKETAHTYLQEMLHLPEYCGRNLDALYDFLTELGDTEICIDISDEKLQLEDNIYFNKIIRVFRAAARENEDLEVTIS